MTCALLQVPGLARTCLGMAGRSMSILTGSSLTRPCCRKLSLSSLLMNRESGQGKEEDLVKYEREYSPSKKYTSSPMAAQDDMADEGYEQGAPEEHEETFGLLSNKFRHKFKPLGSDLIEELEDAKLGDDWVKPRVSKNTPIWYGNQMKKLIKAGKLDEAIEMLEVTMLKEAKVFPTEYNYNVLIGGCGRAGFTHKAFKLYNRMKVRGLEPSSVTYTALFNACAESPWKQTDGLTRLRKLHRQLVEKSVKVNLIMHHAMMKAYAKCGDLEMTFRLYCHLVDSGIHLMPKTFSFLLFACAEDKVAGYLYALEAWRQMMAQGVKPDLYLYNLLLRATRDCGIGDVETASRVLLRDVQPKIKQTPLLTGGDKRRSSKQRKTSGKVTKEVPVLGKKAEMVVIEPFEPDEFLNDYATNEDIEIPPLPSGSKHHLLVDRHRTTNTSNIKSPDTSASNTNVPSVQVSHDEGTHWWDTDDTTIHMPLTFQSPITQNASRGLTPASQCQLQLRTSKSESRVDVPNLLDLSADLSNVQSLAGVSGPSDRLALLGGAQGVLDHMAESGVQPDVKGLSLLAEILSGRKQEENSLMQYVTEQNIKVDADFYNVFIRRRTRRGDLKGAKSVLSHIRGRKLFPNLRTYVNLATGCGSQEEGFQILTEMEEAGIEPTCHVYGALIGASQKHRNYGYLIDILKHMEARGVIPNDRVITQLEKIAAFGQNKIAHSQCPSRPVNRREHNQFRGFYIQWLSRMKVEVPEHPWHQFYSKQDKAAEIKFHETVI